MSLPAMQHTVAEFVGAHNLEAPLSARLLDLTSEIGELAKEVLKASDYGRAPFAPTDDWAAELADVLFALLCLANSTAVDLEAALDAALAKYAQRMAHSGQAGSGR